MRNITEHFTFEELTNSSSFPGMVRLNRINAEKQIENITKTAQMLEKFREIFKSPIIVYSCFRDEYLNKAVGGVDNSFHKTGEAADIVIKNMKVFESFQYIVDNYKDFSFVGKIIYENIKGAEWLHVQLKRYPKSKTQIFTKYAGQSYHLVKEF